MPAPWLPSAGNTRHYLCVRKIRVALLSYPAPPSGRYRIPFSPYPVEPKPFVRVRFCANSALPSRTPQPLPVEPKPLPVWGHYSRKQRETQDRYSVPVTPKPLVNVFETYIIGNPDFQEYLRLLRNRGSLSCLSSLIPIQLGIRYASADLVLPIAVS